MGQFFLSSIEYSALVRRILGFRMDGHFSVDSYSQAGQAIIQDDTWRTYIARTSILRRGFPSLCSGRRL